MGDALTVRGPQISPMGSIYKCDSGNILYQIDKFLLCDDIIT